MSVGYSKGLLLSVLVTCLALQSCGFRLRGEVELTPEMKKIAIVDELESSSIATALKTNLHRSGITALDDTAEARILITIHNEKFQRRVLSISAEGQVQEYQLDYWVDYSIINKDNKQASLSHQRLAQRRDLRFDVTEVLGKTSEEVRLNKDMVNSAAISIMRRLPKVADATAAKS